MSRPIMGFVESLISNTNDYLGNRIDLFKLKVADKASGLMSAVISGIVFLIFFFIFFIIFSIGIALLIGKLLGASYLGFLIMAGFYLLIGLVMFWKLKAMIKTSVSGLIIKKLFKNVE